jgi:hypothetical protein
MTVNVRMWAPNRVWIEKDTFEGYGAGKLTISDGSACVEVTLTERQVSDLKQGLQKVIDQI